MFAVRTTQENVTLRCVLELLMDEFGDGGDYNYEGLKHRASS